MSAPSSLDTARAYLARGWTPVPVTYRDKRPTIPRGWPTLRYEGESVTYTHEGAGEVTTSLADLFSKRVNVGVVLGAPSGGLVDVDLDCPEAARLAERLLPLTPAVFGRASNPASHRLYVAHGAVTRKWASPKASKAQTLLELRSTGGQTVFPGSVHKSGEPVEWAGDGTPATVAPPDLELACRRLAVAALLVRDAGLTDDEAILFALDDEAITTLPGPLGLHVRPWFGLATPPPPKKNGHARPSGPIDFQTAVDHYNADHPKDYGTPGANPCPMCGYDRGFGRFGNTGKWSCFAAVHVSNGGPGRPGGNGNSFHGDALDIDAHEAGLSRHEQLIATGYLQPPRERARPRHDDAPPWEPPPTSEPPPDAPPPVHEAAPTRPAVPKYWILDGDGYAARIAGRWAIIKSQKALRQHLVHDDNVSFDEAKLKVERLPPAEGLTFDPTRTDPARKYHGRWRLNTWYGLPERPARDESGAGYAAFIALFDHLFNADKDWCLDWLARPLQSLASGKGAFRNHTAIVLFGPQGAGKGWLSEILAEIYGEYFQAAQHHVIESQFVPGYLARTLFLFLDEVASNSSTSDLKVLDRLKVWVTESRNTEQLKFKDAEPFDFLFNILFASNHRQPLMPEETDRRYAFMEQTSPLPRPIVDALIAEKEAGWPSIGRLRDMLLARPVPRNRPPPPNNAARRGQLLLAQDAYQTFCDELLDVGLAGIAAEWEAEQQKREQGTFTWHTSESNRCVSMPIARLNQLFEWYCKNRGFRGGIPKKLPAEMQRRIPGCQHRDRDGNWCRASIAGVRVRAVIGIPFRGRDDAQERTPQGEFFQN